MAFAQVFMKGISYEKGELKMKQSLIQTTTVCLVIVSVGCGGGISPKAHSDKKLTSLHLQAKKSNPPSWVLSRGHSKYPFSKYILGVGVSEKSAVSANDSARAELAKALRVKIQSTMTDVSTERANLVC